jgi:hypothetical protein
MRVAKVTLATIRLIAALALAAQAFAAEAPSGAITSKYFLVDRSRQAELDITTRGYSATVRLTGGAPEAGAATNADCTIVAKGAVANGTLTALFQPVTTDDFIYRPAQATREKRQVKIKLLPGSAEVISADTLGYCGLNVDFSGTYAKSP